MRTALQYSWLENPMDGGAWGARVLLGGIYEYTLIMNKEAMERGGTPPEDHVFTDGVHGTMS